MFCTVMGTLQQELVLDHGNDVMFWGGAAKIFLVFVGQDRENKFTRVYGKAEDIHVWSQDRPRVPRYYILLCEHIV